MLIDNRKMIFTVIAAGVGVISVLFMWAYAIESARKFEVVEFKVYRPYVNVTYLFYLLVLAVLWLTSKDYDAMVIQMLFIASLVWIVTAISVLILSFVCKLPQNLKKGLWSVVVSSVCKAMLSLLLLWFVF